MVTSTGIPSTTATTSAHPYHEKQSSFNQLCLVHSVNMIMGRPVVSKKNLDNVCESLQQHAMCDNSLKNWWNDMNNPHKSLLGLGNYDANVAVVVLDEHGYESNFFDTRKPIEELILIIQRQIENDTLQGLLLNAKGSSWWPGSRHWHVCKQHQIADGTNNAESFSGWFLLDSKLDGPKRINDLRSCLRSHVDQNNHIIVVTKKMKR